MKWADGEYLSCKSDDVVHKQLLRVRWIKFSYCARSKPFSLIEEQISLRAMLSTVCQEVMIVLMGDKRGFGSTNANNDGNSRRG